MIDQKLDAKIKEWLKEHREELVEQWLELIHIPSVRAEAAPGAPFGIDSKRAMMASAALFEKAGVSVRVEPDNYYAIAETEEREKTIGLYAHCDVVPAGEGWLYTQPFEPIVKDGYVIGRGSGDNKAGVMASLAAVRMIRELNIPFKSRLMVYLGSAEESRMPDMVRYVETEKQPDFCLVPDSAFPCCLGEKTILRFKARNELPFEDILDFNGGKALNVVLDRVTVTVKKTAALAQELKALIGDKKEYLLTEEDEVLTLVTIGVPRHAGYPEDSVNAAALAALVLKDCQSLSAQDRRCMEQLAHWLGDYYGEGYGIAFNDPEFGKLTAANGMVWVEEGHLFFSTDIRFGTALDHLETEAKLTALMEENGWKMTYMHNRPGYKNDKNNPMPQRFTAIYNEITETQAAPYYMSGGTYARHLKNAYVVGHGAFDPASKAIRPETPAGHGGAHQKDEMHSIDALMQGMRVLVQYLLAADQYINE